MYIGGPCYAPESRIVCRFNKALETNGSYISPERAYCITPRLYVVGLISVELSLDGGATFNFTGRFRSGKINFIFSLPICCFNRGPIIELER